jgi:hypothetical protein
MSRKALMRLAVGASLVVAFVVGGIAGHTWP